MNPLIPSPGDPLDVTTIRDLTRVLRANAPRPGRMKIRRGLGGTAMEPSQWMPEIRRGGDKEPHPWMVKDVSTEALPYRFMVEPGLFSARGARGGGYMFPEVNTIGSGVFLSDDPPPVFTVSGGKDAWMVLHCTYAVVSGVAEWQGSTIEKIEVNEDAPITGVDNDYLHGWLPLLRVARASSGDGIVLKQQVIRSNIMHIKSNTLHHFWSLP